jgi:cell wall-associated NlpC family hydrolase
LSTHCRLGYAIAAFCLALPASALADTGGMGYSSETSKSAQTTSTHHSSTTAPHPSRERFVHLGDRVPLRQGMRGHDVKILQDFFNRIGMQVSIDGEFGHGTWAALRRFERRAGRPVDGVLDSKDLSALRRVVEKGGWDDTSSSSTTTPPPTLPYGSRARLNSDGTASAPAGAPAVVQEIIAAGNEIAHKPYVYGGGHGHWNDTGYDCSGSVSYALHGAGLLQTARDSSGLETFGESGPGQWVTIYANAGHTYMVVAGLRFDTSGRSRTGSRWQTARRSSSGYVVRHPQGL